MASVILCSELGKGSGHLSKLADFAVELEAQGYTVKLVCSDLSAAYGVLEFREVAIFQAPMFAAAESHHHADPALAINYSSILLQNGYASKASLAPVLRGWLHMQATLGADIVVADHAPTAVLAAKLLEVPCIMTGNGFFVPPHTTPMTSIRPWSNIKNELLNAEDERLLDVINETIDELGFDDITLGSTKDMFAHAAQWIVSIPEIDHYGGRRQPYVVRWTDKTHREPPEWPINGERKVYVQMAADSPFLMPLLDQLEALGLPTLAVIPEAPAGLSDHYHGGCVRVQRALINIAQAVEECNVFISDGEHNLVYELLSFGVPSVFLPTDPAQLMLAWRLRKNGLSFASPGSPAELNVEMLLDANAEQDQIWHNAAHVALKYQNHASLNRLHDLVKAELLAN